MDVDSILHIDCKYENLGANDNDLIKTDPVVGLRYLQFLLTFEHFS
jgi:hypothetical protein